MVLSSVRRLLTTPAIRGIHLALLSCARFAGALDSAVKNTPSRYS